MRPLLLLVTFISISIHCKAQSRQVRQEMQREEDSEKDKFPPTISAFSPGTLGYYLQEEFKKQAANYCGIIRPKNTPPGTDRNYIPQDIFATITEDKLRNTKVQTINASANNILFFALKPDDIIKLEKGIFSEDDYIQANRVIGILDPTSEYGNSYPDPIKGFPSYSFQKSCGGYFTGLINAGLNFPTSELKSSIQAETEKSTLITSISGKFVSPLYLMLNQAGKPSVYSHLLIWQVYADDDRNINDKNNLLLNTGRYISDFDATLLQSSNNKAKNIEMISRLSSGINAGIFSIDGSIKAGFKGKEKFSMEDFKTLIHLNAAGKLMYTTKNLPSADEINAKLQSSLSLSGSTQSTSTGLATHLLPFTISTTMGGIPFIFCNNNWEIEYYDRALWVSKPTVKTIFKPLEKELPNCICEVTGWLSQAAITTAINNNELLNVEVSLRDKQEVNKNRLRFTVIEPSVKVSKGPIIVDLNENSVNGGAMLLSGSILQWMTYDVNLMVNDAEVAIKSPLEATDIRLEYINQIDTSFNLSLSPGTINGKSINITIKSASAPKEQIKIRDANVPIKIRMRVRLASGGSDANLISNTITLKVPIFSAPSPGNVITTPKREG